MIVPSVISIVCLNFSPRAVHGALFHALNIMHLPESFRLCLIR